MNYKYILSQIRTSASPLGFGKFAETKVKDLYENNFPYLVWCAETYKSKGLPQWNLPTEWIDAILLENEQRNKELFIVDDMGNETTYENLADAIMVAEDIAKNRSNADWKLLQDNNPNQVVRILVINGKTNELVKELLATDYI